MKHPIYHIESFEQTGVHTLRIRFNDGLIRAIDFEPILEGELFGALRDPLIFARVVLDAEVHTLVWPTGADFDPAILHDWPEHEVAFTAAARRWSEAAAVV